MNPTHYNQRTKDRSNHITKTIHTSVNYLRIFLKLNSVSKRKAQATYLQKLVKTSENNYIFLPVFYLIMWLMKASKNLDAALPH